MFICPCRTQVSFWPMVIAQRSYTKKRGRMKNTLMELLQRVWYCSWVCYMVSPSNESFLCETLTWIYVL